MRILMTNTTLANRSGSELYVRDVATALLDRGHLPIVYSPVLGDVANEIRRASIPVVDDLAKVAIPPDVIHAHHHFETMTALLRFPGVPALFVCHGWLPWEEIPPRFPRILRYLAVDDVCRDRLIFEYAIPEDRVHVLLNFVDLRRFVPRPPLPSRPQRALVFSNYANDKTHLGVVRAACARVGLPVDVIGRTAGTASAQPEAVLGQYDLVFAKGRCALEAMAVGAAVVLCDMTGVGPMVTTQKLEQLRLLNCGIRTLRAPLRPDVLVQEIARYDPADAAEVSRRIRATAGRDATVDELLVFYRNVIEESANRGAPDLAEEGAAAAAYFRWLSPTIKDRARIIQDRNQFETKNTELQAALAAAQEKAAENERVAGATQQVLVAREAEIIRLQMTLTASQAGNQTVTAG